MKIKPIYIFMVAALAIVVAVVFISCPYINAAEEEAAHVEYYSILNNKFGMNIHKEWTNLYYNKGTCGGWHGDGTDYYVFEVSTSDEEFFNEFSQIKSEEFETSISNAKNAVEEISPIEQEYLFDLEQPYEWLRKWINEFEGVKVFINLTGYIFSQGGKANQKK